MTGNFFQKNSTKFLSAFKQLDQFLGDQLRGELVSNHFYEKVDAWYDLGYLSRKQFYDLLQFSKLRNAIVHEYVGNETIAEPSSAVVKRIEELRTEICRPKKVSELFAKTVVTTEIDNCVEDVLAILWKHKISQLPILEDGKIVNVLNTNTIAWWTAATKPENIPKTKIREVLSYSYHQNNFKILSQDTELPEAVQLFRQSYSRVNKGWFMDAILITKDGINNVPVVGIIVLEDLVDYLI
jgi:predicted transcriptional regulator